MVITAALWQDFLTIVREEVGSRVVETWFKAVKPVRWDAVSKVMYLEAPNQFVQQWLMTHYSDLFRLHLGRLLNEKQVSISFALEGTGAELCSVVQRPDESFQPATAFSQPKNIRPAATAERAVMPAISKHHLRSKVVLIDAYRFDTFVVGPSNALAFSAAQAAAENLGKLYNPLFLYGGSGLGKTHLLHAMGHYVKEYNKKATILYQPADRFVHDFVQAIRTNKAYEFEMRYRDVDMLLLDDVQFISKKEQTQEIFFRIFNMLHQQGKQLVLTSDSMPCDIEGLADRIRTRLEGGLVADIHMPSLETKIAILHKKAEANNYVVEDDVAYFIGSRECSSIRELEGMLIRVVAYAALTKQPVTVGLARKVLLSSREPRRIDAGNQVGLIGIAKVVAKHFNYTVRDLRSTKRNKDLVQVRHVAMHFMKKLTVYSLREIGVFFERKDHTTVINALEKVEKQRLSDHHFDRELRAIERKFNLRYEER